MRQTKWIVLIGCAVVAAIIVGTVALSIAGLMDRLGHADIALVLGNKVEADGTPSPRLRARLDKTVELYRAGYFPAVITSGGTGKEGYDEALVMRDYLVAQGIPSDRVMMDHDGTTTFMSARNTLGIVQKQKLNSVLVVSQYFHIPRTRLALKNFGITEVYSAHARYFEMRDLYSAPRELLGYISYLFRHYDADAAPKTSA